MAGCACLYLRRNTIIWLDLASCLTLLTAELTVKISYAKRTHQQRTVPANTTIPSPLIEIHLVEEIIRTNSSEPAERSFRVREALISDEVSH